MSASHPQPKIISRKAAQALGLNRYFTGKACPAGHIAEKRVSCYGCVACARLKTRAWNDEKVAPRKERAQKAREYWASPSGVAAKKAREKATDAARYLRNKEAIDAYNKAWYEANKDRKLAKGAEWHAANKVSVRDRHKVREAESPEIRRAAKLRRRAREANTSGNITKEDLKFLFAVQKGKCAYCRSKLGKGYHADHILPLCLGGSGGRENIQLTCAPCNTKKGTKHPLEFARRQGMLV